MAHAKDPGALAISPEQRTARRTAFWRSGVGLGALGCALACSRGEAPRAEPHKERSAEATGRPDDAPAPPEGAVKPGTQGNYKQPAPGAAAHLGVNFWNVDWDVGNVFVEGVSFATTDNPWRPELLAALEPFSVLRFMDWNGTNRAANPQAHAGSRRRKTDPQNELVAFEWQIDLCNRAAKDLWLTVPHEATTEDWKALASLIHAGLDPSLRVYLEWSNEVWNAAFPQHGFASEAAAKHGLSGELPGQLYAAYASVRLFEVFEEVFGAQRGRLVRVLSGQAEWSGPCEAQRGALDDARVNPRGKKPDVYAIAPYAHGTNLTELRAALPRVKRGVADNRVCAQGMGAQLIAYEAGVDAFALEGRCRDFQREPGLRQFYGEYLDALTDAGMTGPILHYTHTGACWGLREKLTDPPESAPKLQGALDWLARRR